mgnify:CR=1 FL=1
MATVFQYFHTFQCALVLWSSLMLYFVLARAAQPKLTNVFASPWQSTLSAGSHSSRGSQRFPWQSTLSVAVNAFRRQPLIVNVHARHSKITALCILLWMRITRSPPRLMQKKTIILLLCMYGLPRYRGPKRYRPSQTI